MLHLLFTTGIKLTNQIKQNDMKTQELNANREAKAIKINKNGYVSKRSMNEILKLEEVGSVPYWQGNIRKLSKVRGNNEAGYYAMNPNLPGVPYLRVIRGDNGQFIFDELTPNRQRSKK